MILLMLALASGVAGPADPCYSDALALARGELSVFLDPTDATRSAVTRKVMADVLLPAKSTGRLESCGGSYREFAQLADGADLGDLHQWTAHLSLRARTRRDAAETLKRAQSGCVKGFGTASCSEAEALVLTLANDPAVKSLTVSGSDGHLEQAIARIPDVALWASLRNAHPARKDLAHAALGLSADDYWVNTVRSWAFDELIGEIDPREWSPEDIAYFVIEGKAAFASVIPGEDRDVFDGCRGCSLQRAYSFLGRLSRFGYQRGRNLLGSGPRFDEFRNEHKTGSLATSSPHFPGEAILYEAEWRESTGKALPNPRLDPIGAHTVVAFSNKRWFETDEKAPHPDLAPVEALVEKLEAETTKRPK